MHNNQNALIWVYNQKHVHKSESILQNPNRNMSVLIYGPKIVIGRPSAEEDRKVSSDDVFEQSNDSRVEVITIF